MCAWTLTQKVCTFRVLLLRSLLLKGASAYSSAHLRGKVFRAYLCKLCGWIRRVMVPLESPIHSPCPPPIPDPGDQTRNDRNSMTNYRCPPGNDSIRTRRLKSWRRGGSNRGPDRRIGALGRSFWAFQKPPERRSRGPSPFCMLMFLKSGLRPPTPS